MVLCYTGKSLVISRQGSGNSGHDPHSFVMPCADEHCSYLWNDVNSSGFFAIANIVANLIFIPKFGAHGAAWVAVATQLGYGLVVYFSAYIKTGVKIPVRDVLVYVLLALIVFLVLK